MRAFQEEKHAFKPVMSLDGTHDYKQGVPPLRSSRLNAYLVYNHGLLPSGKLMTLWGLKNDQRELSLTGKFRPSCAIAPSVLMIRSASLLNSFLLFSLHKGKEKGKELRSEGKVKQILSLGRRKGRTELTCQRSPLVKTCVP